MSVNREGGAHLPEAGPFEMADGYFNFLFSEELRGGRGTRRARQIACDVTN